MKIEDLTAVGMLARFYPSVVPLLERLEIDYACKGGRSIHDAAALAGHDPHEVLGLVREAADSAPIVERETLSEIIHQIIIDHHRFASEQLRDILRGLGALPSPPDEMTRIRRIISALAHSFGDHMLREERTLFPPIELLELHPHRVARGSMSRPLLSECLEHDLVHAYLSQVRELSARVRATTHAFDSLLEQIAIFDRDAHRHMHVENNVLIPRVIAMENQLKLELAQQTVTQ